jgi:glycosyltransferase involved in cell wall biosynthesis
MPAPHGTPRVSVVIPCRDAERYVAEAIDSALRQTYRDFEIIAVDNGSTDRSLDVLRGYGDAVQVLQEPRLGASRARNAGIAASRGEFIAFLDADDFWEPGKLQAQVALMDERPEVGMVATDYWMALQEGDRCVRGRRVRVTCPDYLEAIFAGYACHISTIMVRRAVIDAVGAFNEEVQMCEDMEFYLRVAEAYPVANCAEPLSTYRRHPAAMVQATRETLQGLVERNDEIIASFCRRNPRFAPRQRWRDARIRAWAGRVIITRDRSAAFGFYRDALRLDPMNAAALAGLIASALPFPYALLRDLRRMIRTSLRRRT